MTLLLLHGFTGSPESWDPILHELSEPQHILRPALTGHGGGEIARSFDEEVERLARIVRWWATGKAHVCGYSLGGRLALALLCRHPDLFHRGTVIGATPGLSDEQARRRQVSWQEAWVRKLSDEGLESFVDAWERLPIWKGQEHLDVEIRRRQRAIRLDHDALGLAHAMRYLDTAVMGDLRPELRHISVPTRLVVGEEDEKFRAIAEEMVSASSFFRVVTVEGAGHNVPLARPAEVAALLEPNESRESCPAFL